jgi:hypothetical protein
VFAVAEKIASDCSRLRDARFRRNDAHMRFGLPRSAPIGCVF